MELLFSGLVIYLLLRKKNINEANPPVDPSNGGGGDGAGTEQAPNNGPQHTYFGPPVLHDNIPVQFHDNAQAEANAHLLNLIQSHNTPTNTNNPYNAFTPHQTAHITGL